MYVNSKRVRKLKDGLHKTGAIAYWMSRDQRVQDNWALLYAQEHALEQKVPLIVTFCLVPEFKGATIRHYEFLLNGLEKIEKDLEKKNIQFILLTGEPGEKIPEFVNKYNISQLISDFDPLKIKKEWKKAVKDKIDIPFYEVDAHNIIPCWEASPKQEYAAYTIRPKIHRKTDEFLIDFYELDVHPFNPEHPIEPVDWNKARETLQVDRSMAPIEWLKPGEDEAHKILKIYIEEKLDNYSKNRNDASIDSLSNLSPYLHYGQISAQRAVLEVMKANANQESKDSFIEEIIVRKELADNFCYYNTNYDNFEGIPDWAKESLNQHREDFRNHIYTLEELETAKTHDYLWNASQVQMITTGKIHGYMRMYWGKKILEWVQSPEQAIKYAIYLNDKYEIDGRDPNGYVGILWSIGGLHDRAWSERPIFGKVRYMSYNSTIKKFNAKKYIETYPISLIQ